MRATIILNPAAGGGRASALAPAILGAAKHAFGEVEVQETRAPGHARRLAEAAARAGIGHVLSVGGDGTHGEVADGIFAGQSAPGAVTLVPLPVGTGGDFTRLLSAGRDLEASLARLGQPAATIDLGQVRYTTAEGQTETRCFLNMASVGLSADVDRQVARSGKSMGAVNFFAGTVRALLAWRAPTVRVWMDDEDMGEHRISVVCGCNGRYAGGGMAFAPRAKLGDGLLDAVILPERPLLQGAQGLRRLYKGTILEFEGVVYRQVKTLRVVPVLGKADLDLDGETPGTSPLEISLLPAAIRVAGLREDVV